MLSAENHKWFNKQTPDVQKKLNTIFQAYKIGALELENGEIKQAELIKFDENVEFISIPIETDEAEILRAREIYEKKKQEELSRAKIKQETRRLVDEYWEKQYEADR